MRKKRYFHPRNDLAMKPLNYLALLFVLLSSCNNDDEVEAKFLVGVANKRVTIYTPNPLITIDRNSSDSLDLDGDGQDDLSFSSLAIAGPTGFFSVLAFDKRSGVEVVLDSTNRFPRILAYAAELNEDSNWSDDKKQQYTVTRGDCYSEECNEIGSPLNPTATYVGIKIGSRFGWVKLYYNDLYLLEITEYALMR